MRNLNFILACLLIFSIGCKKEQKKSIDHAIDIVGTWSLEDVQFNSIAGVEINEWISNSTHLHLSTESNNYYRNYVSGNWSVQGNILTLTAISDLGIPDWNYEILELTDQVLKVRLSNFTEGKYCCDFPQFEQNEQLTIIETYIRDL